ncbi:hypothetical protein C4K40_4170 [Pseudomonas sp. CMR5c]|nr:hypothetical protein C4K40_4170 [Pseudomonas sp. CMR5c]
MRFAHFRAQVFLNAGARYPGVGHKVAVSCPANARHRHGVM